MCTTLIEFIAILPHLSSRAQGKRLMESTNEHESEGPCKALVDVSLFSSHEEYELYNTDFHKLKFMHRRGFDFIVFSKLPLTQLFQTMEWTPLVHLHDLVYPTLV